MAKDRTQPHTNEARRRSEKRVSPRCVTARRDVGNPTRANGLYGQPPFKEGQRRAQPPSFWHPGVGSEQVKAGQTVWWDCERFQRTLDLHMRGQPSAIQVVTTSHVTGHFHRRAHSASLPGQADTSRLRQNHESFRAALRLRLGKRKNCGCPSIHSPIHYTDSRWQSQAVEKSS